MVSPLPESRTPLHRRLVNSYLKVVLLAELGEAPVVGGEDLLAPRELELGTAHGDVGRGHVGLLDTDGQKDLANVDASGDTEGLTESTTHT